jgi:hypothetical protein
MNRKASIIDTDTGRLIVTRMVDSVIIEIHRKGKSEDSYSVSFLEMELQHAKELGQILTDMIWIPAKSKSE